jgi:hypothetical protein
MSKIEEDHGWPRFQSRPTYYDDNARIKKPKKPKAILLQV